MDTNDAAVDAVRGQRGQRGIAARLATLWPDHVLHGVHTALECSWVCPECPHLVDVLCHSFLQLRGKHQGLAVSALARCQWQAGQLLATLRPGRLHTKY